MPKLIKTEFKLGMRRLDDPATLRVPEKDFWDAWIVYEHLAENRDSHI